MITTMLYICVGIVALVLAVVVMHWYHAAVILANAEFRADYGQGFDPASPMIRQGFWQSHRASIWFVVALLLTILGGSSVIVGATGDYFTAEHTAICRVNGYEQSLSKGEDLIKTTCGDFDRPVLTVLKKGQRYEFKYTQLGGTHFKPTRISEVTGWCVWHCHAV